MQASSISPPASYSLSLIHIPIARPTAVTVGVGGVFEINNVYSVEDVLVQSIPPEQMTPQSGVLLYYLGRGGRK